MKNISKKILYEVLEDIVIPNMPNFSISLWKKLCLYKQKLGVELKYFTEDGEYIREI